MEIRIFFDRTWLFSLFSEVTPSEKLTFYCNRHLSEFLIYFQLDPPDSQQLFLRGGGVSFLFEHVWALSGAQYGRFQRILL